MQFSTFVLAPLANGPGLLHGGPHSQDPMTLSNIVQHPLLTTLVMPTVVLLQKQPCVLVVGVNDDGSSCSCGPGMAAAFSVRPRTFWRPSSIIGVRRRRGLSRARGFPACSVTISAEKQSSWHFRSHRDWARRTSASLSPPSPATDPPPPPMLGLSTVPPPVKCFSSRATSDKACCC